jgi:hypothetical protein
MRRYELTDERYALLKPYLLRVQPYKQTDVVLVWRQARRRLEQAVRGHSASATRVGSARRVRSHCPPMRLMTRKPSSIHIRMVYQLTPIRVGGRSVTITHGSHCPTAHTTISVTVSQRTLGEPGLPRPTHACPGCTSC